MLQQTLSCTAKSRSLAAQSKIAADDEAYAQFGSDLAALGTLTLRAFCERFVHQPATLAIEMETRSPK